MALGWLSRGRFTARIDAPRVKQAIEQAERQTSGEIVVSVSRFFWGSVQRAAEMTFVRLDVQRTEAHNGVLIFVVPARRQFVLLGDEGIHAKVGQAFWDAAAEAISRRFRDGDVTGGLVDGIDRIGAQLAAHFPYQGERDVNELPDDIDFARGGRADVPRRKTP
jgi:uncharacterized membrane protein